MILRPPKAPTVWAPHPGSQVQFLTCPIFECLLEGTRGGGKTAALLMSFAQYVGRGFGSAWRGVLFRETYPQLADVATKSKQWFKLFFPGAKFNESTYTWKFPDGEELLLRQGVKEDDYWDYHGHEYPWLGFIQRFTAGNRGWGHNIRAGTPQNEQNFLTSCLTQKPFWPT